MFIKKSSIRQYIKLLFLILLSVGSFLLAANLPRSFAYTPNTNVGGPITTDTTWTVAGSPYNLSSDVIVNPGVTLTIEPGVWVQSGIPDELIIQGHLEAVGTVGNEIVFTSDSDSGQAQWEGITFDGGTGNFNYVNVRHAAQPNSASVSTGIYVLNSAAGVTIQNSTFHYNGRGVGTASGIHVENSSLNVSNTSFTQNGTFAGSQDDSAGIYAAGSSTVTVSGSTFDGNEGHGIYVTAAAVLNLSNTTFQDNENDGLKTTPENWSTAVNLTFINESGFIMGGSFVGDVTLPAAWGVSTYWLDTTAVTIPVGSSLTIEEGATFQATSSGVTSQIIIQGHLQANGTSANPILFSDSDGSGEAQWRGLHFDGGTGDLNYVTITRAGQPYPGVAASAVFVDNSATGVTIQNSTIHFNGRGVAEASGIRVQDSILNVSDTTFTQNGTFNGSQDNSAGIYAAGSSTVTVNDSTFDSNEGHGIYTVDGVLNVSNTTFSDNENDGLKATAENWSTASNLTFNNESGFILGGSFVGNVTLPATWGVSTYWLDTAPITVLSGNTLTLGAGTTFRATSPGVTSQFIIQGHLQANGTAANPILFSDSDDSGLAQWRGLHFDGGTGDLNYVTVTRAGQPYSGVLSSAIFVDNSATGVTIQNSTLHYNGLDVAQTSGIRVQDSSLNISNSTFTQNGTFNGSQDNSAGIYATGSSTVTVSSTIFDGNEGHGIYANHLLTVIDSSFQNSELSGIRLDGAEALVTCATFGSNAEGINVTNNDTELTVSGSTFSGNAAYGLNNVSGPQIDAPNNYWGDATGPFHPTLNPNGLGDEVSDNVIFGPWLTVPECVAPITGLQASNDGPKVETLPVQLTASAASGTGVTYNWDLGDGTTAQGASVSHLYASAGDYTAVVTATSSINSASTSTLVTILPRPNFGGTVWDDADGDGFQSAGELGLSGATITAVGPGGNLQTTSNADGSYTIETDVTGTYVLTAAFPNTDPTTANPLTLPLPADGSAQASFGLIPSIPANEGQINGRAWADANGNGQINNSETPFNNLPIDLFANDILIASTQTDTSGLYSFNGLVAGIYTVHADAPNGYFPDPLTVSDIVVVLGETSFALLDFGLGGTVGGTVVNGLNNGVANVLLHIEQPEGTVLETAVTDNNGFYQAGPFSPGTYFLRIVPPAGMNVFDGQIVRQISVSDNSTVTENWVLDALGSLRATVQWTGDYPYIPIANVDLSITSPNGYSNTITTDYDGQASLIGLTTGLYTITPMTTTLPTAATVNPAAATRTVNPNTSAQVYFSLNLPHSIRTYCQRNTGTQSPPYGPDFPCTVTVTVIEDVLGTPSGTVAATVDLPTGGSYIFVDLPTGTYDVSITPDHSVAGQEEWPDHNEQVVINDGTHALVKYPFNPNYASTSIWGYAFWDKNMNSTRQPTNEGNESSSNGITVRLYDENGTLLDTTITADNGQTNTGWYEFTGLGAGIYTIIIELPEGHLSTTNTQVIREINLNSYTEPVHFGYYLDYGADLHGRAFFDNDGDGQYNANIDAPVGGLTVTLKTTQGTILDTTFTAANGNYYFYPIFSGSYIVSLSPPESDSNPTTLDKPASLPDGNAVTRVDYPLAPNDGHARALIFVDENMDGVPNANEQRVGDALVTWKPIPCPAPCEIHTEFAASNGDGIATFSTEFDEIGRIDAIGLPEGTIMVHWKNGVPMPANSSTPVWVPLVPPGVLTVRPFWDTNGNLAKEVGEPGIGNALVTVTGEGSGYSSVNGISFNVGAGIYDVTVMPPAGATAVSNQPLAVGVSANSAALLDVPMQYTGIIAGQIETLGGDPTWGGLTVELVNLTTLAVHSTGVTAANSSYQFTNIPGGTYRLRLAQVPPSFRLDDEPVFSFATNQSLTQNLTLISLGDIIGQVYLDNNGNGVLEPNESGTDNFDIFLLDNIGSSPLTITVSSDGTFLIPDLQPDVRYALTLAGSDVVVTEAPGWFSVENQNVEIRLGIFPLAFPWDPETFNFNVVYGKVFDYVGSVEQPIAGAEVGYFHWDDTTGCSDSNPSIIDSTVSDVNGEYHLDTLFLPGNSVYCLRVLDLPGYAQVGVLAVPTNYTYQSPGGPVVQPRIDGNKNLQVDSLSGLQRAQAAGGQAAWSAFHDTNVNGLWDAGEQALAGVSLNGTASGLDGSAVLTDLNVGENILTITPPTGYVPVQGSTLTIWFNGADVTLPPIALRLDGALVGSVFADNDGDGRQGTGEYGLADVTLSLSGPVMTTTTTMGNGRFTFLDLPDGTYTLSVVAPDGFTAVSNQMITLDNGGTAEIGLQALGQVTGAVYEDWDGDEWRSHDEPLVTNPITMTLDGVADMRLFGGNFLFWDVPDGTYEVTGWWTAVAPSSVTLTSNESGALALSVVDPGIVRGTVWVDANNDGRRQPWEMPLAGVTVVLAGVERLTDENGRYLFADVASGTHNLEVLLPDGLHSSVTTVTVSERGAAVGIPVVSGTSDNTIYLPIVTRN